MQGCQILYPRLRSQCSSLYLFYDACLTCRAYLSRISHKFKLLDIWDVWRIRAIPYPILPGRKVAHHVHITYSTIIPGPSAGVPSFCPVLSGIEVAYGRLNVSRIADDLPRAFCAGVRKERGCVWNPFFNPPWG